VTEETAAEPGALGLMKERYLAFRINYEMKRRGWSQERLANEMAKAGHPLHQSAISKILNAKDGKRRTISVDEALGFAKVFGSPLESLLLPLGVAQSHEVRQIMTRINNVNKQRWALVDEGTALWDRLGSLLSEEGVVDYVVEGFEWEGDKRQFALDTVSHWLQEAYVHTKILPLREQAYELGEEWRTLATRQLDFLNEAIWFMERVSDPNMDLESLRRFITVKAPELANYWGVMIPLSKTYKKRLEGETVAPGEVAVALDDLKLSKQRLEERIAEVDGMGEVE
jgi:transcriptional regulator with XRE-family HTH domain